MTDTALISEAAAAAVQKALQRQRSVHIKGAVFQEMSTDRLGGTVILDGDADEVGALIAVDQGYLPGERVMCLSYPPAGLVIIGKRAGAYEDWRYVGDADNPAFDSDWQNVSTVGTSDTDEYMRVGFKRQGSRTELRGRATRMSGSANPDNIFVLPEGYRPRNDLMIPGGCGPIYGVVGISILRAGNVKVLINTGSVDNATGGFVSLDGISFAND